MSTPATLIAGCTGPGPGGTTAVYSGRREVARVRSDEELAAALREHFGAGARLSGWGPRADVVVPLPMGCEVAA